MAKLLLILLMATLAPVNQIQAFEVGVGSTSSTSGRLIPSLSATSSIGDWSLTGTTTGVRTNVYYLSAYTLGLVKRFEGGEFGWAKMNLGFGFGIAHSQYGYREQPTDSLQSKSDTTAGPLFQFRWMFLDPVYFGLDALFGLRYPLGVLGLALQDVTVFTIGVSL